MNKLLPLLTISFLFFISCSSNSDSVTLDLKTDAFQMSINNQGAITELIDLKTNKNHISADTVTHLLSLRINNEVHLPQSATAADDILTLTFENNIEANIKFEKKAAYLTFELQSLSNKDDVDLILWGPYFTSINKVIGETVGVVRSEEYAVGIQSLNIKTLGGYPWNESDRMPAFDYKREDDPNNMHPKSDHSVLYRIEAAKPTKTGSSLQAYCRNRNKERVISDFNHEKILVPSHDDGGVVGSKIAIFGCPIEKALETIGTIELAEGLPHPMIDGQWGKTAPGAAAAYIITNFTEDNVQQAIDVTKKAGLKYMYHYGKTFDNWGHFDLYKGEFPNGIESLKACIEKAEAQGVMVGTHFLSNFITTNDPYVTPVPDKRLAKVGSSLITATVNKKATEIPIESPDYFNQMKNNSLKTVMIGDELIRYGKVTDAAPWKLIDCQRGAFGTTASEHQSGTEISKLLDHAYKVFLTNADLTVELSKRMADIYNQTGLRQISFDGLEGNRSTGLGTYGESLMPYTWYNALSDDLKKHLITDASRTTHFFWHIYSRMNWGEPWYAGFRESQTEYRFNNQAYFKRNYMPGMLGWFKMTPETSLEDIEWLLARSAGYDAGYAFVANTDAVEKNGQTDQILEFIGNWEKLRIGGAFTEAQKEKMRNNEKEFSLKKVKNKEWKLVEEKAQMFKHEKKVRQPGEPLHSTFQLDKIEKEQTLNFILTAVDCAVNGVVVEVNNYKEVALPVVLKEGQILKYEGGETAALYDSNWGLLGLLEIDAADFKVAAGEHTLGLDCNFMRVDKEGHLKVEVRMDVREEAVNWKE